MTEETKAGTSAVMRPEPETKKPEPAGSGLALSDVIAGYGDTRERPVFTFVNPLATSNAEGSARLEWKQPGPKTVGDYDDAILGINRKKSAGRARPDEWRGAAGVIREHFVTLTGIRAEDETAILAKWGDWKTALLSDVELRAFAKAQASAYIVAVRPQTSVSED